MNTEKPATSGIVPYIGMRSPRRIGRSVADARISAGMQQADVAEASGVSRETISALENGTRDIRVSTLSAVLKAVGYEIDFNPIPARRKNVAHDA